MPSQSQATQTRPDQPRIVARDLYKEIDAPSSCKRFMHDDKGNTTIRKESKEIEWDIKVYGKEMNKGNHGIVKSKYFRS